MLKIAKDLRTARLIAALGLVGMCTLTVPVAAQEPLKAGPRSIPITVSFNFNLPAGSEKDGQQNVLEQGRKAAYEMAMRECANLLATIAATCRLEQINVNSTVQRRGDSGDVIQVNGNTTYRIEPKPPTP